MTVTDVADEAGSHDLPREDTAETGAHPISVLGKTHLLLAAFTAGTTSLGLTELSRRSGVPKATAHRLGTELVDLGYLARTRHGYQLGWRIFELGQLVPGPANLSSMARPVLIDMRGAVKAIVVHLAVPHGPDTVYLERLAGRREIGIVSTMGERAPSLLTASGRLFLANSPIRTDLIAGYDSLTLRRFAQAGGNIAELEHDLDTVRARRWAVEREECVSGMNTLAVPVMYSGSDRVIAGISASVQAHRRDEQHIIHTLWQAAADISRALHHGRSSTDRRESRERMTSGG